MGPTPVLFAVALLGAAAGLATDRPLWAVAALGAVLVGATFLLRGQGARALTLLAACFTATALIATVHRSAHDARTAALPVAGVFEGDVLDVTPARSGGTTLTVAVAGVLTDEGPAPLPLHLRVRLVRAAAAVSIHPGDRLRLRGTAHPFFPRDRPGTFDADLFGLSRGLHGRLTVSHAHDVIVTDPGHAWAPFADLRQFLRARLLSLLTPREAGVVLALIIGDTAFFDDEQLATYRAIGAGHLLAVSGLQVSLLALIVFFLARLMFVRVGALRRRNRVRQSAAGLAALFVWGFVFLCGAPPSCVRAGAMATAVLLALFVDRHIAALDALGLAGLVTVMLWPASVVDPSFLLSYAAVVGLLLGTPAGGLPDAGWPRARALLLTGTLSAFAAGVVTLSVSAYLFGELSPGGIVANVVLVPVASALQVPAIFLGLAGALFDVALLAKGGAMSAGLLEAITETLAQAMGGVWLVPAPSPLSTIALTGCALLLVWALARRRARWMLAAVLCAVSVLAAPDHLSSRVLVEVLPVGQGDSALVTTPQGQTVLIDGGGVWDERIDPGADVVVPYLQARGVDRIDVMILSHPDPDHLLGLLSVLRALPVGELWHAGIGRHHPLVARLLDEAAARQVPVKTAPVLLGRHELGGAVLDVLAPRVEDGTAVYDELSANDNSLVVRIAYGETSMLFCGDLERWGERYLLGHTPDVAADVVKAPHHGSRTSSSPALIKASHPAHVVFPTGRQNQFGFPHPEVARRWHDAGARLWDTAVHGLLRIELDGTAVTVTPFHDVAHPLAAPAAGDG